ncbi:hypothetical protein [Kineosporia sp. NBRC 101731]|uniref:hypothetical protein n=1 Tax=Kineosporia sp. NBRC 101731 TaxID=3032199 RepID=UPI0024A2EB3C|nr:hypothetical protein [Kineosporia sp. NBRC 101731]GLY30380.1 hypothetical protein Kisp02_37450 [Kineosporia sp. NBRC 101731]
MPDRPPADVRIKALRRFALSITVFNVLGHVWLGFEQAYLTPVVGVLTAYLLEIVLETVDSSARGVRPRFAGPGTTLPDFLLPAHITGLACAMLLYGNSSLWPTIFAVTVSMCSKYIVRMRIGRGHRHVLNPSNLGISLTLVLFPWIAIAPPYQFTEYAFGPVDWIIPAAIFAAGTMLNGKLTRRGPLIVGWLGGFVLQAVLRWLLLGDSLASGLLVVTGVAFVLFTNYMITDPGTTPTAPSRQVAFGVTAALVYGALVAAHVTFGLFYALVITCALRGLLIAGSRLREPAGETAVVSPREAVPAEHGRPVAAGGGQA